MRAIRLHGIVPVLPAGLAAMALLPASAGALVAQVPSSGVCASPRASGAISDTTVTLVPTVQSTVGSTGYATYVFRPTVGWRIARASAKIVGAQRGAVKIAARVLARRGTRYVVKLVFPGEQGYPGRLVVHIGIVP